MGCCSGKAFRDEADWNKQMIECEGKILELSSNNMSEITRTFTMI